MKKDTIERGEKALELMEQGYSLAQAAREVGIRPRNVKKVARLTGWRIKRVKGRIRVESKYYQDLADRMIAFMMAGYSATAACKYLHTTLRKMSTVKLKVTSGRRRNIIIKQKGRYRLNVYHIVRYSIVFYGRLKSRKENVITGTTPFKFDLEEDDFEDDRYANILWQLDFDPFTTGLPPHLVGPFYAKAVLDTLESTFMRHSAPNNDRERNTLREFSQYRDRSEITKLEMIFKQVKVHFDGTVACMLRNLSVFDEEVSVGIDTRDADVEYVTPTEFSKRCSVIDRGRFEIIVRRLNRSYNYPDPPAAMDFKHNLKDEKRASRTV